MLVLLSDLSGSARDGAGRAVPAQEPAGVTQSGEKEGSATASTVSAPSLSTRARATAGTGMVVSPAGTAAPPSAPAELLLVPPVDAGSGAGTDVRGAGISATGAPTTEADAAAVTDAEGAGRPAARGAPADSPAGTTAS